jgi:hypothetical protein
VLKKGEFSVKFVAICVGVFTVIYINGHKVKRNNLKMTKNGTKDSFFFETVLKKEIAGQARNDGGALKSITDENCI